MQKFIKENKELVVTISLLLLLGSILFSIQKIFFYSSSGGEKPVFLDVYGREISVPGKEMAAPQFFDLKILSLTAVAISLLAGGWLLVKELKKRRQSPTENKKDRVRKEDLKRVQEALELYYRVRQRYPEAEEEFEGIVKNLEPPLEDSPTLYRYENPGEDTQRYRLWCLLEDKTDLEAKGGLYELTS